jgi:alkanesulfonate monooxygenase SsuD/methylene tetrahydromethanopterin reductase-like flavin-dependent oxidoreductase (luciferase family)
MWAHWKAGDRDKATASIPDELIDDLIIWGSPDQIREHIDRYVANGVTTPAPAILAPPDQARATMRALAPANR